MLVGEVFLGESLQVRRLGTDGDPQRAEQLLREWDARADAIGLGLQSDAGDPRARRPGRVNLALLARAATRAPVTTGERLAEIFREWAVRHAQVELPGILNNARVLFFDGMANQKLALALSEFTDNLQFADPLLQLGVPKLLGSREALSRYAVGEHYARHWLPPRAATEGLMHDWTRYVLRKATHKASVIVAPVHLLDALGIEELAGKTIVTSTVNDQRMEHFKQAGVHLVIDAAPLIAGHALAPDMLDAMLLAAAIAGRTRGAMVMNGSGRAGSNQSATHSASTAGACPMVTASPSRSARMRSSRAFSSITDPSATTSSFCRRRYSGLSGRSPAPPLSSWSIRALIF